MIDYSNPLATGLVNLWLPEDMYVDKVNGQVYTVTGTIPSMGATARGTAQDLNPADVDFQVASFNPSSAVPWTMFSLFTWYAGTFGTYPVLASMLGDGGASDRSLLVNQGSSVLAAYIYDGFPRLLSGNTTLVAGQTYTGIISVTAAGFMTLYLNGVQDGTLSGNNAGYNAYANPKWAIGDGGYAGVGALGAHFRGYLGMAGYIYGEAWNATKAKMFHENPYQFLSSSRIPSRHSRFVSAVGGGGGFKPAWARMSNVVIGGSLA